MGTVISGKEASIKIRKKMADRLTELRNNRGIEIGLAAIVIGNDGGSSSYIKNIGLLCSEIGMNFFLYQYEEGALPEEALLSLIHDLNQKDSVHGMIVQLPLPAHINTEQVSRAIAPHKDVDCFNPINMGRLFRGEKCLLPCTPRGILKLLEESNVDLKGKKAAVVGRSNIVGKPVAMLLLQKNATVKICHTGTADLKKELSDQDIIVSAVGVPGLITEDMIKEGAIVIDAGTTYVDQKLKGDVDYNGVSKKTSFITPVPGGVGSMTTTMLLENVLEASGYYDE